LVQQQPYKRGLQYLGSGPSWPTLYRWQSLRRGACLLDRNFRNRGFRKMHEPGRNRPRTILFNWPNIDSIPIPQIPKILPNESYMHNPIDQPRTIAEIFPRRLRMRKKLDLRDLTRQPNTPHRFNTSRHQVLSPQKSDTCPSAAKNNSCYRTTGCHDASSRNPHSRA
jgi:hypothetical protein